jgi:hypothetical protein
MEQLFYWLATLNKVEAICLFCLVCILMLFIPYASLFIKICKKIVFWKKLKLSRFEYTFCTNIYEQLDNNSTFFKNKKNDFIIEGGKLKLHWIVEGALWVKVYPEIGKVQGNTLELLIHRNNRHFTLEAKGIFSKKKLHLEIPLEKIKTLETTQLSDTKISTKVKEAKSFVFTESILVNTNFTNYKLTNISFSKLPMHFSGILNYRIPEKLIVDKLLTEKFLKPNNILKQYTFNSNKYNSINQQKP